MQILRGWNFLRIIRLALGVMLVGQAFQVQNWPIGLFGGLFIFQSLTNTGCCGAGACNVTENKKRNEPGNMDDVVYEEVK